MKKWGSVLTGLGIIGLLITPMIANQWGGAVIAVLIPAVLVFLAGIVLLVAPRLVVEDDPPELR